MKLFEDKKNELDLDLLRLVAQEKRVDIALKEIQWKRAQIQCIRDELELTHELFNTKLDKYKRVVEIRGSYNRLTNGRPYLVAGSYNP